MNRHPGFLRVDSRYWLTPLLAASWPCAILHAADPSLPTIHQEFFLDDSTIASQEGVDLRLHEPRPCEAALTFDRPWEGNTSCYVTVFRDGDICRMYFRGSSYDPARNIYSKERTCYAESRDGIHWYRPELGIVSFEGSKANNILWEGPGNHNFTPFRDDNPECPADQRYKAVGGDSKGLLPFVSADGVHWRLLREEPIITLGAFDSQNVVFWDAHRRLYVSYHRDFRDGVRDIRTCTSKDFIHWSEPQWLDWGGPMTMHLYTNAIIPYPGAPDMLIGFPKRFLESRTLGKRHYPGVSDGGFMTSRDGVRWTLWPEAILRPGPQYSRWGNRNNMIARGIIVTPSLLTGAPDELSIYSTEGYYEGPCVLRRHVFRQDGFTSLHAGVPGGTITTRLIKLDVPREDNAATDQQDGPVGIRVNFSTSAAGTLRCEILDEDQKAIPGFGLAESEELFGDEIAHLLRWGSASDIRPIVKTAVHLRFHLEDANLFGFRVSPGNKQLDRK